jgi:hypothetical protein
VVVPVLAPIFIVVAAVPKLIVVAFVGKMLPVVAVVRMLPDKTHKSPRTITSALAFGIGVPPDPYRPVKLFDDTFSDIVLFLI